MNKVTTHHLARMAYLYIRQSSLHQVQENRESTARQYDLKRRAQALGWTSDQVVVIDEDLGLSGVTSERNGFQRELGIRARIISLLHELTVVAGFEVHSSFDGPVDSEHLRSDRRAASGHRRRGGHQRWPPCSGHSGEPAAQRGERRVPAPGHRQRAQAGST